MEHARCGHCGGTQLRVFSMPGYADWKNIVCQTCGAGGDPQASEDAAWKWWDTRPVEDELRKQLAEAARITGQLVEEIDLLDSDREEWLPDDLVRAFDRAAAWLAANASA